MGHLLHPQFIKTCPDSPPRRSNNLIFTIIERTKSFEGLTMSLVDELLADFSPSPSPTQSRSASPEPEDDLNRPSIGGSKRAEQNNDRIDRVGIFAEIESSARLMDQVKLLLENIEKYSLLSDSVSGTIEDNPEYKLLVEVNALATDITGEITVLHKYVAEKYNPRFPELESLVLSPVDYAKTVKVIGADIATIKDKQKQLTDFLPAAIVMVLTVSAVTSKSRDLTDDELKIIMECCDVLLFFDSAHKKFTQYVATKMTAFAPNTAALVGSVTAAELFGVAGGLAGLSKLPSCNIPSLGVKRNQTNIGLGNTGVRQQGFLYFSALVQSTPMDLRRQALRILAAKVSLAARIDIARSNMDGMRGLELKNEVEEKLEKLGIPPSNQGPKALPAPDDRPSKKRGGRRIRKYKQKFAMTDLRKAQNRMKFGEQDGDYIS
ncbi:uncharacterized protein V1516DRAFT_677372 [Lipomyces oligophaga]|uniref:uncharacterized protein n=1 Tax=Lipomyces oligophaga TaxID=45792 RepID=UPI0034CEBD35